MLFTEAVYTPIFPERLEGGGEPEGPFMSKEHHVLLELDCVCIPPPLSLTHAHTHTNYRPVIRMSYLLFSPQQGQQTC